MGEPDTAGGGRSGRPFAVYVLTAALGTVAAVAAWWEAQLSWQEPPSPVTAASLLVVLAVAGSLSVTIRRSDDDVTALNLFEAAVAPTILLVAGPVAVVLVAAAKAVGELVQRVAPTKLAFNVCQWAAAAGVGGLVFTALGGPGATTVGTLATLVVALLAVSSVNHVAVLAVLRLVRRSSGDLSPDRAISDLRALVLGSAATICVGLLLGAAASWEPVVLPLAAAPLVVLHRANRSFLAGRADLRRLRGLQRATHSLVAPAELGVGLDRFLEEVRVAFDATSVELLVEDGDGTTSRSSPPTTTASAGDRPRRPGHDAIDSVRAVRRTGDGRGWHTLLAAPVRGDGVAGSLCVYDPGAATTNEEADLAVLEALAREVAGALERDRLVERIVRSESRFRSLVQHGSDLTVVIDRRGIVQDCLPTSEALSMADELQVGTPLATILHPDDLGPAQEAFARFVDREGATATVGCRVRAGDGSWHHVEAVATNLLDDPAVGGVVLTCRDVTHRERSAALLTGQTEVLEAVAADRPLPEVLDRIATLLEGERGTERWSLLAGDGGGGLCAVAGSDLEPAVTDRLTGSRPADDTSRHPGCIRTTDGAAWFVRADGPDGGPYAVVALSLEGDARPEPDELRLLRLAGRLLDVARERVQAHQLLVRQATRDPLTGLPNRLVFLDRATVALSRLDRTGRGVGVVFVDLDRFKVINDSLGHDAGDRLLIMLGTRLHEAMRANDTVARFGGDEFTILCDDVAGEDELRGIADRVRATVALPVVLDGHEVSVTASLGMALATAPTTLASVLIDNADTAMYRAKARGGNRTEVFDPAVRTRALRDLVTRNALRTSIERGDLRVHYQPIISLERGTVVGVEALVRWQHPELGLVPPNDFVPLAEQTGLIVPLGEFVLRESCRQVRRWESRLEAPVTTSVNLSARQFADVDLPERVAGILDETGVDPSRIIFEITETVLMENVEATSNALRQLTELGVDLRIDDFGTGYSSLSYLKRFPVGGLKIDRSFVSGLGEDPDDSAIVSAVVGMAHSLGMLAVAEGVETAEQLAQLHDLGCDVAQGYYFSRPVPADEVPLTGHFT